MVRGNTSDRVLGTFGIRQSNPAVQTFDKKARIAIWTGHGARHGAVAGLMLAHFFQGKQPLEQRPRWIRIKRLTSLYQRIVNAGVDSSTPPALMDRVIFSNLICLIGTVINLSLAVIDFSKGYSVLFAMTLVYQAAMIICFTLNNFRRYLAARIVLLCLVFGGMFYSSLVQGPQFEMEHFFLPLGVLAFTLFYAEERIYGILFLVLAIAAFVLLVSQSGPLLNLDPAIGRYSSDDLLANRVGYLALFFACLVALTNAFNRALRLVNDQRSRLFEERRMATIGAIACNVAHEINSPLTALDLQIFQLNERVADKNIAASEIHEDLARMSGISRRMSVIVRGLKFLTGQDDNDPFSRHEIGAIIELSLDLSRDLIESHGIQLQLQLEGGKTEIACRPVALSQVFLNLINNAIDAVAILPQEHRRIQIASKRAANFIEISVEDGGIIASDEIKANLFKNFFTTKPPGRGTGLGLSISKESIENHGGSIRLDSESVNTRFVILIPLPKERQ